MKTYFANYEEAFEAANEWSKKLGSDIGLEKWDSPLTPGMTCRIFMLPAARHRQGFETRCQIVRHPSLPPTCHRCGEVFIPWGGLWRCRCDSPK